jgi:2-methylcitrate dehydratase PrpD
VSTRAATAAIAGYAAGFDIERETPTAVERAKSLILDLLGVAYAGAVSEDGTVGRIAALVERPDGPATIAGTGARASAADAALVNGYAAHLLEFDDSTLNPVGHPSTTILPAVLALAEARGCGGRDVLAAYMAGLEVHSRLGQAKAGNWSYTDPWLPIGTIGVVGAAAATARLLGLDPQQAVHCVGLGAHLACQLNVSNGSLAKPLGAGHSARCAVQSAELAEVGVTAAPDAIEAPGGFAATFLAAGPEQLEVALRRLGTPSHLDEVGVAVKRYPSCYGSHWSIDALRELLDRHALEPADVRSVELVYPQDAAFLDRPEPATAEEARFSLQYGLAACLLDGYPRLESFREDRIASPAAKAALGKVGARPHAEATPEPERWSHRVTVTTASGAVHQHAVKRPRGHPRNPLTADDVREKFLVNVAPLGVQGATRLLEDVERIEELDDVRGLAAALTHGRAAPAL